MIKFCIYIAVVLVLFVAVFIGVVRCTNPYSSYPVIAEQAIERPTQIIQSKTDFSQYFNDSENASEKQKSPHYTAEIFPREIYWGDYIYIRFNALNPYQSVLRFANFSMDSGLILEKMDSDDITEDIVYWEESMYKPLLGKTIGIQENPPCSREDGEPFLLEPGKKVTRAEIKFQVPYLENQKDSFWQKEFRDSVPEGRTYKAQVILDAVFCISFPLKIKRRPEAQMQLFNQWSNNIAFSPLKNNTKRNIEFTRNYLTGWGHYSLVLDDSSANPSRFFGIPVGNPYPLTGVQLEQVENILSCGTLRDEIKNRRLIEEYKHLRGRAREKKWAEIKAWLESLPPVQASILAQRYDAGAEIGKAVESEK